QLYPVNAVPSPLCYSVGNGTATTTIACGSVQFPTSLTTHPTVTQRQLDEAPDGPYCVVIEDYRRSSAFDVLGSIGGLLALLQGVHVFLFGRPLFWGMFVMEQVIRAGAKLLTPFGLVGRFANKGFRRRLQDYYYPPSTSHNTADEEPGINSPNTILISRFLLDYVLDLGPASATRPATESGNANPSNLYAETDGMLQRPDNNRLSMSES
ncbi:hypothetical protein FRC09_011796, partial [Ceratobasidium sp. 395]